MLSTLIKARLYSALFLCLLFLNACSTPSHSPHAVAQTILAAVDGRVVLMLDAQKGKLILDSQALVESAATKNISTELWLLERLASNSSKELSSNATFDELTNIVGDNELQVDDVFDVELARYISQADFSCREPLYFQYFQRRYSLYENLLECDSAVPFNVLSRYRANNIVYVDPKLLSDIHIVFASKDDNMMSQFGHISLRLVICPAIDSTKAECEANLYQHIVLGYMAHVDEIKINQLKGLLGDYKAYLYANSFMDVYQKYTISEFRDIYSLPLNLSQQERETMLRALAEIHWGFAGDYKFISRNCSSLMQLALTAIWPEFSEEAAMQKLYWRPDYFFEQLQKTDVADAAALENLALAEEGGYYFASTEEIYIKAFSVVNAAMGSDYYASLDAYMMMNPIERFDAAQDNHGYMHSLKNDDYLLEAQLMLEELSLVRFEYLLNAEMGYFFEQYGIAEIDAHMHKNLDSKAYAAFSECMLEPITEMIAPKKRSDGIPSAANIAAMPTRKSCQQKDKATLLKQVGVQLQVLAPDEWGGVKAAVYYWTAIIRNINSYKALRE